MAHEPDVALFKTTSSSLARKQILADFLQSTAKQRILPERSAKVATDVVFSCRIARLVKVVSNWKVLGSHVTPMPPLYGSHGNPSLNKRLSWLSKPKRFLTPAL